MSYDLNPIIKIGGDSSFSPLITDIRKFSNQLVVLFHDQPNVLRIMAPRVDSLQFDGTTSHQTGALDDMERPNYAMEPEDDHKNITGTTITVPTPQIYHSVSLANDHWARLFAGKERLPLAMTRMVKLIKNEEDIIGFRGRPGVKIEGLIGATGSEDLGNPVGPFGDDSDGDGILENLQAAVLKGLDHFTSEGLQDRPVDVVLTSYIYTLANTTVVPYDPKTTNLDIMRAKLNGGNVYTTNFLQENVAKDANSMLMVARTGPADAAWEILSSGIEQSMDKVNNWKTSYGMREKFAPKILQPKFIAWMDEIDAGVTPP